MSRLSRLTGLVAILAVLALVLVTAVLIGMRLLRSNPTYAVDTPLPDQCPEVPSSAERLVLTADDGFQLGAAVVGEDTSTTALVIRQGAGQTICQWLPLAGRIAEETGMRVLLFDRRGRGSSPGDGNLSAEAGDTLGAIAWLRERGVEDIGLMASSMGNSVMFTAVPDVEPAPCVIVSVSPVLVSGDGNGTVDGTDLSQLPENVWVVAETENGSVASYAERVVAASGTEHYLEIETSEHSFGLIRTFPEAADFVVEAASSCGTS